MSKKEIKLEFDLAGIKNFFKRDYRGYPNFETEYGVPHPAEMLMKLRYIFTPTGQIDKDDLTKRLFVLVAAGRPYQHAYFKVAHSEEKLQTILDQETKKPPLVRRVSSFRQSNEDKIESISSNIPKVNYLYDIYQQTNQIQQLSENPKIKEIFQIHMLMQTEFPAIQREIFKRWQNYGVLNDCVAVLKSFLQNHSRCHHLQVFDKYKMTTLKLTDREVTPDQQRKLVNTYLKFSQALAVLQSLAKSNKKNISLTESKQSEEMKIEELDEKLIKLSKNYDEVHANDLYTMIQRFFQHVNPVIENLTKHSTEFKVIELKRQELLNLMSEFNIVPVKILQPLEKIRKEYAINEISRSIELIKSRMSSEFINVNYQKFLEDAAINRSKKSRLKQRQTVTGIKLEEQQENSKKIAALDAEYKALISQAKQKLSGEWKEPNMAFIHLQEVENYARRAPVLEKSKDFGLLQIYKEWFETMFLEIDKLAAIFPKLVEMTSVAIMDENPEVASGIATLQYEEHQLTADESTFYSIQSRVNSALKSIKVKNSVEKFEIKCESSHEDLYQLLGMAREFAHDDTFENQYFWLSKTIQEINERALVVCSSAQQILLGVKTNMDRISPSDAFILRVLTEEKTLLTLDINDPHQLGREWLNKLNSAQRNPLMEPIFNFIDAEFQLIALMDRTLDCVSKTPTLNVKECEAIALFFKNHSDTLTLFGELYVKHEIATRQLCNALEKQLDEASTQSVKLYNELVNRTQKMENFSKEWVHKCLKPTPPTGWAARKLVPAEMLDAATNWATQFESDRQKALQNLSLPVPLEKKSHISFSSLTKENFPSPIPSPERTMTRSTSVSSSRLPTPEDNNVSTQQTSMSVSENQGKSSLTDSQVPSNNSSVLQPSADDSTGPSISGIQSESAKKGPAIFGENRPNTPPPAFPSSSSSSSSNSMSSGSMS
jgi:hypothetical protein